MRRDSFFSIDGRRRSVQQDTAPLWSDLSRLPDPNRYSAPELHPSRRSAGAGGGAEDRADVYSAAVVIWALFAGHAPHPFLSDAAVSAAAADPKVQLRPVGGPLPARVASALRGAWGDEAARRPSAGALLEALESAAAAGGSCRAGCAVS